MNFLLFPQKQNISLATSCERIVADTPRPCLKISLANSDCTIFMNQQEVLCFCKTLCPQPNALQISFF